jgi:formylmethanofuran dehydrogenase subunit B
VTVEDALAAAADVMRGARRPFLGGLATDVAGMRAAMALARRIGAVVDHAASEAKYRNLYVLQESGWITTTLAEVKNHADVVVLVGDGWHARFPRFVERVIAPATDLAGTPRRRRAILLDERSVAVSAAVPPGFERLPLGVPVAAIPAVFGMIAGLAIGQQVDPARVPGVPPHMLTQCVEWLRGARYGVVVWAAADLEPPHAELTLQALSHLIRVLNRAGRFAGLPLAGNDGDLTANAVHTWQAGVSLPASHANGRVDFDPHRYRMREVLARGEADCLLWISSLSADRPPQAFDGPVVVLGRADMQFDVEPAVFLPVATPGVDADGHLLRSDKVISLYLRRLREGRLASVAQALHALLERMG